MRVEFRDTDTDPVGFLRAMLDTPAWREQLAVMFGINPADLSFDDASFAKGRERLTCDFRVHFQCDTAEIEWDQETGLPILPPGALVYVSSLPAPP